MAKVLKIGGVERKDSTKDHRLGGAEAWLRLVLVAKDEGQVRVVVERQQVLSLVPRIGQQVGLGATAVVAQRAEREVAAEVLVEVIADINLSASNSQESPSNFNFGDN